jgi:hypothetical protein
MTFRGFETRNGTTVAVFDRHKIIYEYDENGNYQPITDARYTKEALEYKVRNLKASGYAAPEGERALGAWPP